MILTSIQFMLFGKVLLNPNTRKNVTDLKETSLWDFFFLPLWKDQELANQLKRIVLVWKL